MTFILLYMTVLVFQTYWGILTMRDTRWGTRSSTVDHARIDPAGLTVLAPAGAIGVDLSAGATTREVGARSPVLAAAR
jgi:hypothetical protein